jgi:signal transduction histidine kinase
MRWTYLICCFLAGSLLVKSQEINSAAIKAAFVSKVLGYVNFPEYKNSNDYVLGIVSASPEIVASFQDFDSIITYRESKIIMRFYSNLEISDYPDFLFIDETFSKGLNENSPHFANSFVITDGLSKNDYYFINLSFNETTTDLAFDLGVENIFKAGYSIQSELFQLAGSNLNVNELVSFYEDRLNESYTKLDRLNQILKSQETLIEYLATQIDQNKDLIQIQTRSISNKEKALDTIKTELETYNDSISSLKNLIKGKEVSLDFLLSETNDQSTKLRDAISQLNLKENEIDLLDSLIKERRTEFEEQVSINQSQSRQLIVQRYRLVFFGSFLAITLVLALLAYLSYRSKNKVAAELSDKNRAILHQNEEIERQQKQILVQNQELEEHKNHLEKIVDRRTKELSKAKEKAETANKLKTSFLSNMSHEIRTPLNAIIGFTNILVQDELEHEERLEFSSYIDNSVKSLMSLLDDIMNVSLIEAGQLKMVKQEFSLHQLLTEMLQVAQLEKETKLKTHLEINYDTPECDLLLNSDLLRVKQIFNNLIVNAIKYTEEGTINFGFNILSKTKFEFYVKDTGIGIPEDQHDVIFELFRKIEEDHTKLYRGVGLGLAISKKLTELLNGKIHLESEKNIGSTFYVRLSYKQKNSLPLQNLNEKTKMVDKEYNYKGKTILIAEDEDSNFRFLSETLKRTQANLMHAKDGEEVIQMVKENHVDLILMDIKMPNMNGYEATILIKEINPDIPIIAQTAYAMNSDREEVLQLGCDNYIAKPIESQELLTMLDTYLG